MAYAEPEELATALRIGPPAGPPLTPDHTEVLQACLDAAAVEIDHELDRRELEPLPDPTPALVSRVNINRAVEWYKAPDTANGGVGFDQIGSIAEPGTGFERHAKALIPFKQRFGVA